MLFCGQVNGYDWRADIWSFGMMAIELARGKAPYDGLPPMKVLLLIIKNPPPTLEVGGQQVQFSPEFHELVQICLQKNPMERPSARALLDHPFFIDVSRHNHADRLAKILDSLESLDQRFQSIEKHLPRSGVWSVKPGQVRKAASIEGYPASFSWDFSTKDEEDARRPLEDNSDTDDDQIPMHVAAAEFDDVDAVLLLSESEAMEHDDWSLLWVQIVRTV